MTTVDLVIKSGKLLIPNIGIIEAGLVVDEGRIVSISKDPLLPNADDVIDASGKYVLPGVIDSHVHYGTPMPINYPPEEDFRTETQSAAVGGVTTIIDYLREPRSYFEFFDERMRVAERASLIDFASHLGILVDKHIEELPDYAKKLGVISYKFYPGYRGEEAIRRGMAPYDDGLLYLGLKSIGSIGPQGVGCVHAENVEIINKLRARLMKEGRDGLAAWEESRPSFTEAESVSRSIMIARAAGCRLHIVHMSAAEGVEVAAEARSKGFKVTTETCPHYLTFTKEDKFPDFLGKFQPPLRDAKNVELLWRYLRDGKIDILGGEHASINFEKVVKKDFWSASLCDGSGSGVILPVLLSEGVNRGRITLERVAEVSSWNVARIFGLYPRKGAIMIGSDADFAIVDMHKRVVAKPEIIKSASNFTLYDGWEFKGWPVVTIVRGNIVVEDNEVVGKPGTGRYLPRRVGQ